MNIRTLADFNAHYESLLAEFRITLRQLNYITSLELDLFREECNTLTANIIDNPELTHPQKQEVFKNSSLYPLSDSQHPKSVLQELFFKMMQLTSSVKLLGRYHFALSKKYKKNPALYQTLKEVELTPEEMQYAPALGADDLAEILDKTFQLASADLSSNLKALWQAYFTYTELSEQLRSSTRSLDDPSHHIRNSQAHILSFISMLNNVVKQTEEFNAAQLQYDIASSIPQSAKLISLLKVVYASQGTQEASFASARLGEFIRETYDKPQNQPIEDYLAQLVRRTRLVRPMHPNYQTANIKAFLTSLIQTELSNTSLTDLYTTFVATTKLLTAREISADIKENTLTDISEGVSLVLRLQPSLPSMSLSVSEEISDNIGPNDEAEEEKAEANAIPLITVSSDSIFHTHEYMLQNLIPQRMERKAMLEQVQCIRDIESDSPLVAQQAQQTAASLTKIYETFYAIRLPTPENTKHLKIKFHDTIDRAKTTLGRDNVFIKAVKFMSGVIALLTGIGALAEMGSHFYRGKSLFFESSTRDKVVNKMEETKRKADSLLNPPAIPKRSGG